MFLGYHFPRNIGGMMVGQHPTPMFFKGYNRTGPIFPTSILTSQKKPPKADKKTERGILGRYIAGKGRLVGKGGVVTEKLRI
jgi:hypothetical protein